MKPNIVKKILSQYFKGNYQAMGELFGVTSQAVRKWELVGEFPAKNGRTQQAHELTNLSHRVLTPSAFKSPNDFKTRLAVFLKAA
ncbi:hypothetical protein F0249_17085 [Vibrio sp. 03-59-1]|uniref:hypothetical protein n=1 Tax=Vibrio sp. 03-59-1 TaxID=2607607 RepID=UPI0014937A07|nr:hypothetical protein [Vibrio sp. 03-59-1]NOH85512.1 hypothetical protein [Vibrio sp. 03-59-1]